tara:strand:+ start:389 stop:775 length:387 start_codon:yes stop_codon:yes gene_type:complete
MDNQFFKTQLKLTVKEYLELDDQIKMLNKAARERRKRKKELSEEILTLMEQHELTQMNLKDGKLIYAKSKNLVPLNKKHIVSSLSSYFRDDHKATELFDYLMKSRTRVEKVRLKRTKNKKAKTIDLDN